MSWGSEINSTSTPEVFELCLLLQLQTLPLVYWRSCWDRHVLVFLITVEILQLIMDWSMMARSWLETNGTQKKRYKKKIK